MTWATRLLVAAFSALFLIIGVRTMIDPQSIITQFELGRQGITGTSAIRADIGGFFVGTSLAALVGLLPGKRQWLLGAATMVALAFVGRAMGVMNDGLTANIAQAMIIEGVSVALLVAAFALLKPRHGQSLAAPDAAADGQAPIASAPGDVGLQNDTRPQRGSDLAPPIV